MNFSSGTSVFLEVIIAFLSSKDEESNSSSGSDDDTSDTTNSKTLFNVVQTVPEVGATVGNGCNIGSASWTTWDSSIVAKVTIGTPDTSFSVFGAISAVVKVAAGIAADTVTSADSAPVIDLSGVGDTITSDATGSITSADSADVNQDGGDTVSEESSCTIDLDVTSGTSVTRVTLALSTITYSLITNGTSAVMIGVVSWEWAQSRSSGTT